MKANYLGSIRRRWISKALSRLQHAATFRWLRAVFGAVWLFLPGALDAQDFTLDWFSMAAGGGESSGGDFELSATIGEPDAGDTLGGDFVISGGFWSLVSMVETPGARTLTVSLADGGVNISWPEFGDARFTLEETAALTAPPGNIAWTTVSITPESSNGTKSVRLPLVSGNRFYRLHRP